MNSRAGWTLGSSLGPSLTFMHWHHSFQKTRTSSSGSLDPLVIRICLQAYPQEIPPLPCSLPTKWDAGKAQICPQTTHSVPTHSLFLHLQITILPSPICWGSKWEHSVEALHNLRSVVEIQSSTVSTVLRGSPAYLAALLTNSWELTSISHLTGEAFTAPSPPQTWTLCSSTGREGQVPTRRPTSQHWVPWQKRKS